MISYGRQNISEADLEAVREVLQSDFLTQGPQVPAFEREVATACGARHACAVNSGTSALHLACLALGLGPGDRLWTSPITFVASANCALYCGAQVDFVDVDSHTGNMSAVALEEKLAVAKQAGRLPKIVIPVHLGGHCCDMRTMRALARQYGFHLIEDASHALGGRYLGEPVGNCQYSDITVFSFHPVKIITTGEGGMALTNAGDLAEQMELLRSHGITRDPQKMDQAPDGPWHYQQIELGYNYRMTDIQAALGRSQLQRMEEFVTRRNQLAQRYDELLADTGLKLPWRTPDVYGSFHLYMVRVPATRHAPIFTALREAGIGVALHYIPVHTQPYYRGLGFKKGDFPMAESRYGEAMSLPLHPQLTESQQEFIAGKLREALV